MGNDTSLEFDVHSDCFKRLLDETGLSYQEVIDLASDLLIQMADVVKSRGAIVSVDENKKTFTYLLFKPFMALRKNSEST